MSEEFKRLRNLIKEEVKKVLTEFAEDNYWITPDGEVEKMEPGVIHSDFVVDNLELFFSEEEVEKLKNNKDEMSAYAKQQKAIQDGAVRIKDMGDMGIAIEATEDSIRNHLSKIIQIGGKNPYQIDIREEDGSIKSMKLDSLEELMNKFSGRGGTSSSSKLSRFR